jgi:hypothetical protein
MVAATTLGILQQSKPIEAIDSGIESASLGSGGF